MRRIIYSICANTAHPYRYLPTKLSFSRQRVSINHCTTGASAAGVQLMRGAPRKPRPRDQETKRPIKPELAVLQPAQSCTRYSPLEHWLVTVKAPVLDRKRRQTILVQTGVRFEDSGNCLQATQNKVCSPTQQSIIGEDKKADGSVLSPAPAFKDVRCGDS